MRGTDWQEVNRKITEFYNAIKECEFFLSDPERRRNMQKFQNMDVWKKGMIRVRNGLRRTGL